MIEIITTNRKEVRIEGLKISHLKIILNALEECPNRTLAEDTLISIFRIDIGRIEARKELE